MKYLVTSALPYANAPLHLGHALEIIQTDAWVRHKNLNGSEALYFCASDTHGTPIMLQAEELGVKPENLVAEMRDLHEATFKKFNVNLANFYTTHSEESKDLTQEIYSKLLDHKYIFTEQISQLFDDEKQMFLSDRFVKGTCPHCGAKDQYGDGCEVCGKTYNALELISPVSELSQKKPSKKESKHYFFDLEKFTSFLSTKVQKISKQQPMINKMSEWLDSGLSSWDISRDGPYFGFKIPGEDAKFFYVWLDAPIGYLASIKHWCELNGKDFNNLIKSDSTKLIHFIGKDIAYFHLLFWPAVLEAAGMKLPEEVFTHGFMTMEGKKMSKSRGNFISAEKALEYAPADFYRYYISSKLNESVSDIDFSLEDFAEKVNSDLVGKFINIPSRIQNFIYKHNQGKINPNTNSLNQRFTSDYQTIINATETRNYALAIRHIMKIADEINLYVSENKPWDLEKTGDLQGCLEICSEALVAFKSLVVLMEPYIPEISQQLYKLLNLSDCTYSIVYEQGISEINKYEHIIKRLDRDELKGVYDG